MTNKNIVNKNLTSEEEIHILSLLLNKDIKTNKNLSQTESFNRVKELIDNGFNVNYEFKHNENWTLLNFSIFYKKLDIIDLLIKNGAKINHCISNNVNYLHLASSKNLASICSNLIKSGIPIDSITSQGRTSLMQACESGAKEAAFTLIDLNANTEIKDNSSLTCFDYAEKYNQNIHDYSFSNQLTEKIMYKDNVNNLKKSKKASTVKF